MEVISLLEVLLKFGPKVKMLAQRVSRYQPLNQYEKNSNYSWLLMEAILNKWCSEVNVPVIIFTIPTYHYIEKLALLRLISLDLDHSINLKSIYS